VTRVSNPSRRLRATLVVTAAVAVSMLTSPPVGAQQSTGGPAVIEIGALLSITGPGSSLGNTSRAAMQVAAGRWNQQFARQHRATRVKLDFIDTGQEPTRAVSGFNSLADRGVRIVVGPQSSSEVAAIQPLANTRGVLVVSQGSTASSLAMPNDNVFRFVPNDHIEGRATTDLLVGQGAKVVVPLWRDDRGNQGLSDSVRAAATASGAQVAAGYRYEPATTDFGPAVTEIGRQVAAAVQQVGPGNVAVYLAGFEEVAGVLTAAAQIPGLTGVRWYGGDGSAQVPQIVQSPAAAGFAGRTSGFASPLVALPASNAQRDAPLIQQIGQRAHSTPDAFALAAYDAFNVGVRTLTTTSPTADGPTLRAAFASTADGYSGVTGTIQLDTAGDRASAPYAYWSVCTKTGRARWTRTGTWTPNPTAPSGTGTVTGGSCPR
jgi:branched-chain amino acid transport system substrate-binding protein